MPSSKPGSKLPHFLDPLPLPDPTTRRLKDLFRAIQIEEGFRQVRTAVEVLVDLFADVEELPPALHQIWDEDRELIRTLEPFRSDFYETQPNVLQGKLQHYPVLATFLASPSEARKAQFRFLQQLFLANLLVQRRLPTANFNDPALSRAAEQIRLSREEGGPRAEVLNLLPRRPLNSEALRNLPEQAKGLEARAHHQQAKDFLKTVRDLANWLLHAPLPGQHQGAQWRDPSVGEEMEGATAYLQYRPDTGEGGDIEQHFLVTESGQEATGRLSDLGFKRQAERSHFLGRQWQAPSPWDPSTVIPLEWPDLKTFLEALVSDGGGSAPSLCRADRLLTALVGCTSLDLEALLSMSVGPQGDFSPEGSWRRTIELPEGAYHPAPDQEEFAGVTTQLPLPLPPQVAQLLNAFLQQQALPSPLGQLLGVNNTKAEIAALQRRVEDALKHDVSLRLTFHHLKTALRNQVHIQTGCEITSYCLAGHTDQIPPIGLLYLSPAVEDLKATYLAIAHPMFEAPS